MVGTLQYRAQRSKNQLIGKFPTNYHPKSSALISSSEGYPEEVPSRISLGQISVATHGIESIPNLLSMFAQLPNLEPNP
ncbi:hypothetical protein COB72_09845 [bacterium]|nr:MAG: hypothetical protein COB72_09845 [bacterium]